MISNAELWGRALHSHHQLEVINTKNIALCELCHLWYSRECLVYFTLSCIAGILIFSSCVLGQCLSTSLSKSPRNRYFSYFSPLQQEYLGCLGVRVSGRGGASVTAMLQCSNILDILTTSAPGTPTDPDQAASHWSRCPGPCPPPGLSTTGWSCPLPTSGPSSGLISRLDNLLKTL